MLQRLTDLVANFRVYALCVPCGRMEPVDLDEAITRLGAASTMADLRDRVRCRACGQHTRDVRLIYMGPCGRSATFHYRR